MRSGNQTRLTTEPRKLPQTQINLTRSRLKFSFTLYGSDAEWAHADASDRSNAKGRQS
jgi:hypothetical protein